MKLRVGGIFIPVTDLERSIEWYMECLNLKLVDRWPEGAGAGFTFENGEAGLGLVKVETKQPTEFRVSSRYQNCYYNFEPENVQEMHQFLKGRGVKVTEIEDHGPMEGFDFFDPDGNPFSAVRDKPQSPYYHPFQ
ncbi:MAG TPA: VOC family protein [Bacillales bacterium]|nr:VOC family protein [Bacillales bacterium]